jgi:polar amino acid transport system substrate-binding protein
MSFLLKAIIQSIVFLIPLTFSNLAFAQKNIKITVGEWPPYISQGQKYNGVISHIMIDIFKELGIDASFHFLPWSRAYADTAKGLYAATGVWMHKTDREKDFIYSNAVLTEKFVFFHKKTFKFDWTTINDLKDLTIGGISASSYGPILDKALTQGELSMSRVTRPQQNFKMLLHNRIDIFPFEINVGQAEQKEHLTLIEQEEITHHPKAYLNNESFVLFPKRLQGSIELQMKFNKQLKKFREDGRYESYFNNFKQGFYDKSK